jgi:hypothetical protein
VSSDADGSIYINNPRILQVCGTGGNSRRWRVEKRTTRLYRLSKIYSSYPLSQNNSSTLSLLATVQDPKRNTARGWAHVTLDLSRVIYHVDTYCTWRKIRREFQRPAPFPLINNEYSPVLFSVPDSHLRLNMMSLLHAAVSVPEEVSSRLGRWKAGFHIFL